MLLDNALNRQKKIERADELYRMNSSSVRAAFRALKDLNPNTRRRHRDTLEALRCIKAAKILAQWSEIAKQNTSIRRRLF